MKSTLFTITKAGLATILCQTMLFADPNNLTVAGQKNNLMPGYNASDRIQIAQNHDVYASASFIFWQPVQENMQLGVVSNNTAPLALVDGHEVPVSATFRPGFQVALGTNFDYDNWDSCLEYTWFFSHESASASVDPYNVALSIFPAWQIPSILNPQYSVASETWKLTMNLLDWDLGRGYDVGKELVFRPFIGMRAAFIKQTVHVNYTNLLASDLLIWPSTQVNESAKSWGVGPRLGIGLSWNLGKGFRLLADGEWDILFTQYKLNSSQQSDTTVSNQYIVNTKHMNYLRTHGNLDIGFGWGTYFLNDKFHVDLLADYCFQVFFDQNMFRSTASTTAVGKSVLPNGNLYINGLTISARFDF